MNLYISHSDCSVVSYFPEKPSWCWNEQVYAELHKLIIMCICLLVYFFRAVKVTAGVRPTSFTAEVCFPFLLLSTTFFFFF